MEREGKRTLGTLLRLLLVPPMLLLLLPLLQLAGGAPLGQGLYPMPAGVLQGQWGTGTGTSLGEGLAVDGAAAVTAGTPEFALRKEGKCKQEPQQSPLMPVLPGLGGK